MGPHVSDYETGFMELERTNGRTDGRTDGSSWILHFEFSSRLCLFHFTSVSEKETKPSSGGQTLANPSRTNLTLIRQASLTSRHPMDARGRAPAAEDSKPHSHSLPTGANPKLPASRQPLLDLSNIVAEDQCPAISQKNYAQVIGENAQLTKHIADKSKITEEYEEQLQKLKVALQGARKENWQLAKTNSEMLAELNQGKDRLKNLQHELTCTTLVLQQKKLEIQEKQRIIKQLQQQVKAQGKQVDLAAESSFGGKRKKTDIQSTGQGRQEVPRRKMDDRRPLRRQSVAKAQITSSSIVQSVKVASSSGSSVSLHGEGRRSTRRTSIATNSGIHIEEPTDDSSKQEEDNSVSTDVDTIIPLCAVEAEPDTEPEVLAENATINDDITVSSSDPSNLYTEQQITGGAVDGPCLSIVPVPASQPTAPDVHQEAPREKLGNSNSTNFTGDDADVADPSAAMALLTTEVVCQEAPKHKQSIRRRSIATVHTVSSSHVQSMNAASCSGSNVPLHEEGRKSTRGKTIRPGSGIQLEVLGADSCNIVEGNSDNTRKGKIIPSGSVKSGPGTEQGTKHMPIKEEIMGDTDILHSSSTLIQHAGNDALSRPQQSLAAARRSSLNRPLPLRRAVEKVASYREQPVNVKMRRVE